LLRPHPPHGKGFKACDANDRLIGVFETAGPVVRNIEKVTAVLERAGVELLYNPPGVRLQPRKK
jgi:hypothetical protein